jgi:hypothetical protein
MKLLFISMMWDLGGEQLAQTQRQFDQVGRDHPALGLVEFQGPHDPLVDPEGHDHRPGQGAGTVGAGTGQLFLARDDLQFAGGQGPAGCRRQDQVARAVELAAGAHEGQHAILIGDGDRRDLADLLDDLGSPAGGLRVEALADDGERLRGDAQGLVFIGGRLQLGGGNPGG